MSPTVSIRTEQLSTAQGMIENDLALGFMFKPVAERIPSLKGISLSPPIYVDVSVLRKKDAYVSEGIQRLEGYLAKNNLFEK